MTATLIPAEAFATPPSAGGVRVRLWDSEWNLIGDNSTTDTPGSEFLHA